MAAGLSLSICIPTYNRSRLLAQALTAVLTQMTGPAAGKVEVLVLDNASPDDTPQVVAEAAARFPLVRLRSVRHPVNIGMDGNFLESVRLAEGRFVFLLSDDDVLLPGGVAKLLALIEAHPDFDGFCLNVRSFNRDPEEPGPSWLPLSEDVVLTDRDAVLALIRGHVTYMSIVAFNKSRIAERLAAGKYQDKIGTYFSQCYLFLDALSHGCGFAAAAQPLVAQRTDNAHRLNFFRVFVTEFHALMDYAQKAGYSQKAIVQSKNENLVEVKHFLSRVFIYNRQKELWSSRRDGIACLYRAFGLRPYLWLRVVPIMFFPRALRPVVYAVRRLLGRPAIEIGTD